MAAFSPSAVKAAEADLGISSEGISFSSTPIISGDEVRVYAQVKNYGDADVEGYVSFFQGSIPIGDSQVISARAGGVPEEAYVDFVVPSGTFNIRAEIRGTDPQDENGDNDVAITKLFTPTHDDDRDGVENDEDNCPSDANAVQKDNDRDGLGDVCDDDDDDDGITDEVEEEIGTDPFKRDTDNDGIPDAQDADPLRYGEPAVAPPPAPVAAPVAAEEPEEDVSAPVETALGLIEEANAATLEPEPVSETPPAAEVFVSPNAIFSYERTAWDTYRFRAQVPSEDGYRIEWLFGDGVTSNRADIEHQYRGFGEYAVTIRVIDPDGQVAEDKTLVRVTFFDLKNPMLLALVALLVLLIAAGLIVYFTLGKRERSRNTPLVGTAKHPPVKKIVRAVDEDIEAPEGSHIESEPDRGSAEDSVSETDDLDAHETAGRAPRDSYRITVRMEDEDK